MRSHTFYYTVIRFLMVRLFLLRAEKFCRFTINFTIHYFTGVAMHRKLIALVVVSLFFPALHAMESPSKSTGGNTEPVMGIPLAGSDSRSGYGALGDDVEAGRRAGTVSASSSSAVDRADRCVSRTLCFLSLWLLAGPGFASAIASVVCAFASAFNTSFSSCMRVPEVWVPSTAATVVLLALMSRSFFK